MPVFTRHNKRILYVHIPRTAGKSIRMLLQENGWKKEEINPAWKLHGVSYNHQTAASWKHWGEFDLIFTIVRNPYARLESEARRHNIKKREFFTWLARAYKNTMKFRKTRHDNHFLSQNYFVEENTLIFKFEDGFKKIIEELAHLGIVDKNAILPWIKDQKRLVNWKTGANWKKNEHKMLNCINKAYDDDFKQFGYEKIE